MNTTVLSLVKRTVLVAVVAAAISWEVFHANILGANVTATWTYDYDPEPACSVVRSTHCIHHFEIQDITDPQNMALILEVSNPEHPTGRVDRISSSFKYGPPFGRRVISVVAVGRDLNGKRVSSNPFAARATVNIRPRAKMSLLF